MADDPQVVWMAGRVRIDVHLVAEDTAGAFCMLIDHPPVGWTLPAHRHRYEAETIHIIEGDFEMEIDGVRSRLGAGQTVHIPRGTPHAGANAGSRPGRRVVIFSPAGIERFFLQAGATSLEEVDPAGMVEAAIRYGWEFIDQP